MKINIFIIAAFAVAGFGHIFSASHPPLRQQDTEGDVHGSDISLCVDVPCGSSGSIFESRIEITYLVRVPISDSESIQAAAAGVKESKKIEFVVQSKDLFLRQMSSFFERTKRFDGKVDFKLCNADGRKTPERPGTPKDTTYELFSGALRYTFPPVIKITVAFSKQDGVDGAYREDIEYFTAS